MKRMFALVAILCAILAGCAYGSSGGNHGNPQPAPSSNNNSDCGYTWNPCGGQSPPAPIASADAAVPHFGAECSLGIPDTPVYMPDKLNVTGEFILGCVREPAVILVTARLESKNSAGNWVDEAPIMVLNSAPPIGSPKHYYVKSACYPGWWRLEVHWSGLKSDGKTPFPNPIDGDTPADNATTPVYIGC